MLRAEQIRRSWAACVFSCSGVRLLVETCIVMKNISVNELLVNEKPIGRVLADLWRRHALTHHC